MKLDVSQQSPGEHRCFVKLLNRSNIIYNVGRFVRSDVATDIQSNHMRFNMNKVSVALEAAGLFLHAPKRFPSKQLIVHQRRQTLRHCLIVFGVSYLLSDSLTRYIWKH